jgi:hypothetical protein
MAYSALPDRRINYDNDGSIVAYGSNLTNYNAYNGQSTAGFNLGFNTYMSSQDKAQMNDTDYAGLVSYPSASDSCRAVWFIFPEQREVTATVCMTTNPLHSYSYPSGSLSMQAVQGSNDTTNGVDGSWEAASLSGGPILVPQGLDKWRSAITSLSFTGGKKALRFYYCGQNTYGAIQPLAWHIFGEKVVGQTPDDIIFINHDDTPGVEYTAPEDFGDQPLGTTVVRQFRLKNVSGTKTANTINIQCNDTDFAISEDGVNWVVTINIASLSAGAESATLYVRCTTPAVGNLLGPDTARIVVTVASYT